MREVSARISANLLRFFVVSISYSGQIAEVSQIGPRRHHFEAIHHHLIFRSYIQTVPDLRNSCVLGSPVQIDFDASWNFTSVSSTECVNTREFC